ncbi:MAG: S8 family serine peptidase [Acidobacteria bacterium]|nr:S8 family serine peptidase [Acidobacteriota bacterium]
MAHLLVNSGRRYRPWSASVILSFTLCAALTPRALEAQGRVIVSTSVDRDERGAVVATTVGGAGPAYHPSRVLVRFRNGARIDFLPGSGSARTFPRDPNLYLVPNPPGISVAEAVRRYRANPSVLYVEPDYQVQAVSTPTDPLWGQQWDMVKISAPAAWNTQTDSSDVVVAIIDTGIDYTHPEFLGNLWVNTSDNSNGYTCMNGACVAGGLDDFGHGTHVAGTIGAAANNGIGIAGINWKVKLLSLKFLGSNGSGYISDAVLCFQKVSELKAQGINIRVTSNSWGGGGFSQALKDAMAAVEAAGAVNVCAAGNSGQNADASPMYPAAYDNHGIISVLATDSNDVGAGFTNYGLFSVDIAAPGVNTLSTVPTGVCTLCDPSGYKLLSGTSMATPHVSGVLAALFHKNPLLTANQARDVVLDPGSYDALSDPKAQSTSTGGRLNFAKALGNPLLLSPKLNNFPTVTMGPDVFAAAGSQVNLTATASDPDSDTLRMAWAKSVSTGTQWLFGWMLNSLFPNPTGSPVSFTAPSLARTATVPYDASVADGRGGGAHGRDYLTVSPAPSPGQPPSGTLTVSPTDAPAGSTISVNFPATDPEGGPVAWDLWVGMQNGASGVCCYTGSSASVTLNNAGVYRIGAQAIDKELNLSTRSSQVVRIGGATGVPPIASATLDKLSGPVPLTVNIDMSGSSGTVQYYFFNCGGGAFTPGSLSPKGSCTFDTPGVYWLILEVQDTGGNVDIMSAYVVATPVPSGGGDTTPPTVNITNPGNGANVTGTISISANASDVGSGVSKTDFYRDAGVLLGTSNASASPYTVTWDSSTTSPGAHTIYAIATDKAGNTGTSPSVGITMTAVPPQVSITSPANGATVTRKSTFTIKASVVTGAYAVSRVDIFVGSTMVCSDTTSPYSCNWQVPAAMGKTYQIHANVYDTQGQSGTSGTVTVTAK